MTRRRGQGSDRRRVVVEKLFTCGLCLAAWCTAISLAAMFAFLAWFSLPLLQGDGLSAVLSWTWRPFQGQFGILPMVVGSALLGCSALILAYPAALGICCFVHGLGPQRLAKPLMAVIRFMTGVPTVVYGFSAVFLLTPFVRELFGRGAGFCWLTASLMLAILVLPTIVLIIDAQFSQVEPRIRMTCEALGMDTTQRLLRLTLPLSSRGLLAAAVLGFGRAAGDAIIPLMLSGNAPQIPASPLDSIRTLSAHIALVLATDSQSTAYYSLFAAGIILFGMTVAVNLCLRWLGHGGEGGSNAD